MKVGDKVWVINSHRNRANLGTITEITPEDIEVEVPSKDEPHYFDPETHLAVGDYWEPGETRPQLVPETNAFAQSLAKEAAARAYAVKVRNAVSAYAETGESADFVTLASLVANWPENR